MVLSAILTTVQTALQALVPAPALIPMLVLALILGLAPLLGLVSAQELGPALGQVQVLMWLRGIVIEQLRMLILL